MRAHIILWLAVVAVVLGGGKRAAADSNATVLLVGKADDPTLDKMREELVLLSLGVVVLVDDSSATLASLAEKHAAGAAARVAGSPPTVEVWVGTDEERGIDSATFKVADGDSERLVIRAVELLRGRLLPVPAATPSPVRPSPPRADPVPAPAPTASEPPPPAKPNASPPPRHPQVDGRAPPPRAPEVPAADPDAESPALPPRPRPWRLSLGVGPSLSPGGVGPTFQIAASASYRFAWRAFADLFASLPTATTTLTVAEGDIALRMLDIAGGFSLSATEVDASFSARGGAGLGAMSLFYEATPRAPNGSGSSGSSWNVAPFAFFAASYAVVDWLAVGGRVRTGIASRDQIIRVAGREVASFGRPFILLSLGLEGRL